MATECERFVLPLQFSPIHYDLDLVPDLDHREFKCVLTIDCIVNEATNAVVLHSKELSITKAYFTTSSGTTIAVNEISYHLVDTRVKLTFAETVEASDKVGKLVFEYSGLINGDMAGFYISNYTDADDNKKVMASTQFEALDARRAFPCWDEPAVKATFALALTIPNHLTAISNMPENSLKHIKGGKKKVVFDTTPKMSTYLLAFAVGEFDCLKDTTENGVSIGIYCPPGTSDRGHFALDVAKRALDFYDDYFGLPYPLPKLDMLCCTEFAMGAMENWGLVTYREVDLMIDEVKASSQQRQRVAIVVTHELAHQWFGNLVTMEWWNDLWLNEGFASFMENYCTDHLFKNDDWGIWEQYGTDTMGAALRLDSLKSSHPIEVPIGRAEEVEQVFDAISYCKGSTAVRMAFCLMGPEKFQNGLKQYMEEFKYGNTITKNLWDSWSKASGIDIGKIMEGWTRQMGYPYIQVVDDKWDTDSVEVTLKQSWFLADGSTDDGETKKVWSIPLKFCNSSGVVDGVELMTEPTQIFKIPLGGNADSFVKINAEQFALARVAYSPSMTTRLHSGVDSLPAVDRGALISDAYALAQAGIGSVEDVVQLLKQYGNEANSSVWKTIATVLNGLKTAMSEVGGEAFESFKAFGAKLVKAGFNIVGWTQKPEDTHSDKLLRATLVGLLSSFCSDDEDVVKQARSLFDEHFDTPSVLPSDIKTTVYRIVVKSGGVDEYERVLKTFYTTNDNVERKFAMYSLGVAKSVELKKRTLDWAVKSGDVKLQDFFYPISPTASDEQGSQLVWDYFKDNIDVYKTMLKTASPSLMDAVIVNSVSQFNTIERATEIESYFKENPLPKSERKINQCIENMKNNGRFLLKVKSSKLVDAAFWA